jgi:parallel beta-helix repeat protein
MFKRALCLPVSVIAMLVVGTQPAAAAWHKDPDVTADLASLQGIVAELVAPDVTLGDTDTTPVGVGADAVGIDDSLTNPPADPADDSQGTIYFVNNNPSNLQCPATPYTTIQSAVNASGPNDKVKVCPGTYEEQVRISGHGHDGLKLESVVPLQAVIKWPAVESFPLALVDFNNADHVTLRSFTITGPFTFPACSPDRHEGLLIENAFGERIHHNHITRIQNSLPANYGCQEGDAVSIGRRSGVAQPGSAEVDHNQIDEYQKNGVQAVNSGTSAHVDHNVVTGSSNAAIRGIIASNGVVVFGGAAALIDHNVISQNQFTAANNPLAPPHISSGIIFDEAPSNSSRIDHNRVLSNDYGIEVDSESKLEISHNDVAQNTNDAVTLCGDIAQGCGPATAIVVRSNNVQNNGGSGILLLGANNNLIKSNDVDGNGSAVFGSQDGIHLDFNSTGNQVLSNHAFGNQPFDCDDDSIGAANTWAHNKGDTSNPPGLCTSN